MDEPDARGVLDALAAAVPDGAVLWRGAGLAGNDVDVVVVPGRDHVVARTLRDAGLSPAPQDPGRILWRRWPGETVIIDVLAGHAWPAMYPPLGAVVAASRVGEDGWRVASAGDRLLVFAAEAVAGRSAEKLARRMRAVLAEPGARESLAARGAEDPALARLARDPDALGAGRLSLARALGIAARSPRARAALRQRLGAGAGIALPPAPADGTPRAPGALLALNGMDGAGKSTAALGLSEAVERAGRPVIVYWTRLAADLGALASVGRIVRAGLGRLRPAAPPAPAPAAPAPEAPAPPAREAVAAARPAGGLAGLVDAVWVFAVAGVSVREARRAARLRRQGLTVICDRWLLDTLVDLRLRYGRQPAAEWLLRRGFPAPDQAILLDIDAATAGARKPGDQTPEALATMATLYPALAREHCTGSVDARQDRAAVEAALRSLIRPVLGPRG